MKTFWPTPPPPPAELPQTRGWCQIQGDICCCSSLESPSISLSVRLTVARPTGAPERACLRCVLSGARRQPAHQFVSLFDKSWRPLKSQERCLLGGMGFELLLALSLTSRSAGFRRAHRRMAACVRTYMHRCAAERNQKRRSGGRFLGFHVQESRSPPAVSFLSQVLGWWRWWGGRGRGREGGVFHFPSHITSAAADLQVSTSGVFGGEQRTNDLVKVKLLSEPLRTQRHV